MKIVVRTNAPEYQPPKQLTVSDILREKSLDTAPTPLSEPEKKFREGFHLADSKMEYLRYFNANEFIEWLDKWKLQYLSTQDLGSAPLTNKNYYPIETTYEGDEYTEEDLKELSAGGYIWHRYFALGRLEGGSMKISIQCTTVFTKEELESKGRCITKREALENYVAHCYDEDTSNFLRRFTNYRSRWMSDEELAETLRILLEEF
jgi:hypothetical protein